MSSNSNQSSLGGSTKEGGLWDRYRKYLIVDDSSGFSLDVSRMNFDEEYFARMQPKARQAVNEMQELVSGAIANADEGRMVGHYWLRNSALAPSKELAYAIDGTIKKIKDFAQKIHSGKLTTSKGEPFRHVLVVGIGGSALGPQLFSDALSRTSNPLSLHFFDNTDSDGFDKVLAQIPDLRKTLVVVVSKSGGTKETRNGQLIAKAALESVGVRPAPHMVAVTGDGSELDNTAISEGWLERFPMWDWVGGRTSEWSAVGLLPAALEGHDIDRFLAGGAAMDQLTAEPELLKNPAMLLALMWYHAGCGKGLKDMVILPYRDRYLLLSRYLQQLVMESLGKEKDRDGALVYQGIAVYGNKGSTDQHAYIQQLRDGINNFFACFVEVLDDASRDRLHTGFSARGFEVEPGVIANDYLAGFYLGTREALSESNRENLTITVKNVSEFCLGQLIALFERAVGFYASLVNVNAYHQPGVEAGKKAAANVLATQGRVLKFLYDHRDGATIDQIAVGCDLKNKQEIIFHILRRLEANRRIIRTGQMFSGIYKAA